eukprot:766463-Hanusia_phi.AAC.2
MGCGEGQRKDGGGRRRGTRTEGKRGDEDEDEEAEGGGGGGECGGDGFSGPWSCSTSLFGHFVVHEISPPLLRDVISPFPDVPPHLALSCVTIGMLNILIAQLTITYDKLSADKEGFAMKHR